MINKEKLIARIEELCKEKGISLNTAFIESKVGKNFKANLKTSEPSLGKLSLLANYFGVSVEYLKCEMDDPSPNNNKVKLGLDVGRRDTVNKIVENKIDTTKPMIFCSTNDGMNEFRDKLKKALDEKSNVGSLYSTDIHMIPVFENASAGFGSLAIDYVVDYEAIYIPNQNEAKETICIKVKGDSMYPKIEDGDIIQVHKQDFIDSGSIGVVMVGNEAFVKKIVYSENWVELHSINPMYKTMRYNGKEAEKIRIVGLVKRIFKEC